MGWIRDATGGFTAGLLTLAGALVDRRRDRPVDSTRARKIVPTPLTWMDPRLDNTPIH